MNGPLDIAVVTSPLAVASSLSIQADGLQHNHPAVASDSFQTAAAAHYPMHQVARNVFAIRVRCQRRPAGSHLNDRVSQKRNEIPPMI